MGEAAGRQTQPQSRMNQVNNDGPLLWRVSPDSEIILCVYGAICVKYFNVNALGTTKQKPQLLAKKQETSLDKNETVDDDAEESDEAKESEADQDSSNGPEEQSGSSGNSDSNSDQRIPRYSSSVNVCQITKASQTDPLRRYLVQTLTNNGYLFKH